MPTGELYKSRKQLIASAESGGSISCQQGNFTSQENNSLPVQSLECRRDEPVEIPREE